MKNLLLGYLNHANTPPCDSGSYSQNTITSHGLSKHLKRFLMLAFVLMTSIGMWAENIVMTIPSGTFTKGVATEGTNGIYFTRAGGTTKEATINSEKYLSISEVGFVFSLETESEIILNTLRNSGTSSWSNYYLYKVDANLLELYVCSSKNSKSLSEELITWKDSIGSKKSFYDELGITSKSDNNNKILNGETTGKFPDAKDVNGNSFVKTASLGTASTSIGTYAAGTYLLFMKMGDSSLGISDITLIPSSSTTPTPTTHTLSSVIDPAGKATVTLSATEVAEGTTATATYSNIAEGYKFSSWSISGTGATLSDPTANPVTITMGTADATITLNLEEDNAGGEDPEPTRTEGWVLFDGVTDESFTSGSITYNSVTLSYEVKGASMLSAADVANKKNNTYNDKTYKAGVKFNTTTESNYYIAITVPENYKMSRLDYAWGVAGGGRKIMLAKSVVTADTDDNIIHLLGESPSSNASATIFGGSYKPQVDLVAGTYYICCPTGGSWNVFHLQVTLEELKCLPASATLSAATDISIEAGQEAATTSIIFTKGNNTSDVEYTILKNGNVTTHATIEGDVFSATEEGTYVIRAMQEEDGTYCQVVEEITINVTDNRPQPVELFSLITKTLSSDVKIAQSGELNLSDYAEITGGSAKMINGATSEQTGVKKTDGLNFGTNTVVLEITLNDALNEGDIITATGLNQEGLCFGVTNDRSKYVDNQLENDESRFVVPASFSGNTTLYAWRHKGSGTNVKTIKVVRPASAGGEEPVETPVESVTISGNTEGYVGLPVTFTATAEPAATEYQWFVGEDKQEETTATFTFTPSEIKDYTIKCQARNQYNKDEWIESTHTYRAAKLCGELISYVVDGGTKAKDIDGRLKDEATLNVSLTTGSTEKLDDYTGYKMDKNKWVGVTLKSGTFKVGDEVSFFITKASDLTDNATLFLYNDEKGSKLLQTLDAGKGVTGWITFVLRSETSGVYLYRSNSDPAEYKQNPYVAAVKVTRDCDETPSFTITPDEIVLDATSIETNPTANVTFVGKNLTPGIYSITMPTVQGLSVQPATVTVDEDGFLNANVTFSYSSEVEVTKNSTTASVTINGITKNITINYSAVLAKDYATSINIEQLVLDNGKGYDIKAALAAANIDYANIDALDSLDDAKDYRNYGFLGLKLKKSGATIGMWVKAGSTLNVRFGFIDSNVKVSTETEALAKADYSNDEVENAKAYTFKATEDTYVLFTTPSDKTVVFKQIMIDDEIASVVLPYRITFMSDGEIYETSVVYENTTIKKPADPTKDGYNFLGWYLSTDESKTIIDWTETTPKADGNLTFVAKWEEETKEFAVNITNPQNGTLKVVTTDEEGKQVNKAEVGTELTIVAEPVDDCYELKSVSVKNGDEPVEVKNMTFTMPEGDVIVSAEFEKLTYTVTFMNGNEQVSQLIGVECGSTITVPNAPQKDNDAQFTYTWEGWKNGKETLTAETIINSDVTYTATWTSTTNSYTIIFVNGETELQKETLEFGAKIEYKGETPAKDADDQYTYTFRGWDPELTEDAVVKGDQTYEAQFNSIVNKYTITFKYRDAKGEEVTDEKELEYGAAITAPQVPATYQTVEKVYTFTGWDIEPAKTVIGTATYEAQYSSVARKYAITWIDGDGKTLKIDSVEYDVKPEYTGATPTKTATPQYTYEFNGTWEPEIVTVKGDAKYTAQFDAKYVIYTITFVYYNAEGELQTEKSEYKYNETIVVPQVAASYQTADKIYTFTGWDNEPATTATANVTYIAQYDETDRFYTVIFYDEDGETMLWNTQVKYNTNMADVEYKGTLPVAEKTIDETIYEWIGWTPELGVITTEGVTYKAVYIEKDPCVKDILSYSEDFSDATNSDCWTMGVLTGATIVPSFNAVGAYLYMYNTMISDSAYAIMPPMNVYDMSNYQISFDAHGGTTATYLKEVTVGIVTNATDLSTFEPMSTLKLNQVSAVSAAVGYGFDEAYRYTVRFSDYEGDWRGNMGNRVMFLSESGNLANYVYIDNVKFNQIGSVLEPLEVWTVETGMDYTVLTWDEVGTQYDVKVSSVKIDPETQKADMFDNVVNGNSVRVDGLQMLTRYYVYVRTIGADGQKSLWSNMRWFDTQCPQSYALPYTNDFSGKVVRTSAPYDGADCWQHYYDGVAIADGTSSFYNRLYASANKAGTVTADNGLYLGSTFGSATVAPKSAVAVLPAIDADLSKAILEFDWRTGVTTVAETSKRQLAYGIAEYAEPFDAVLATVQWLDTINTGENYGTWIHEMLSLSNYTGKGKYIVLCQFGGNGSAASTVVYAYLDNVLVSEAPEVFAPATIECGKTFGSTAELTWTQTLGDYKQWQVVAVKTGEEIPAEPQVQTFDTLAGVFTGLERATTYDFYVRAVNDAGKVSPWVATPATGTTLYLVEVEDAFWNFDNKATQNQYGTSTTYMMENGWLQGMVYGTYSQSNVPYLYKNTINSTSGLRTSWYAFSGDTCMRFYSSTTYGGYVVMPQINCNLDSMQLRFMANATYCNESTGAVYTTYAKGSYIHSIKVGYMTDPYDYSTFHEITTYVYPEITETVTIEDDPTGNRFYKEVIIPLYGAGEGNYIAFSTDFPTGTNTMYIDDIRIEKETGCAMPTSVSVDSLAYDFATITWKSPKEAWNIILINKEKGDTIETKRVTTLSYDATNLLPQTTYTFAVQAVCDENQTSDWEEIDFTTPCKPYTEAEAFWNFQDNLYQYGLSATYLIPECSTVGGNATSQAYFPYVTANNATYIYARGEKTKTSTNEKALRFYTTTSYYNEYWAMPELDIDLNSMMLHFWGRAASFYPEDYSTAASQNRLSALNSTYSRTLVIGAMTDADDFSTFVPLDTIMYDKVWSGTITTVEDRYTTDDKTGNDWWQEYIIPLDKYAGKGRIAIMAPQPTATSYFFVDDMEIVDELYRVRFLNYNGEVLNTQHVSAGHKPVYFAQQPTKPMDDKFTYEFAGWEPEIEAVSKDQDYVAQFTAIAREYEITWVVNGETIKTESVAYGTMPVAPKVEDYMNESTVYTFKGWNPAVVEVTEDAQYEAIFDEAVRQYEITWIVNGQTTVTKVNYDEMPVAPEVEDYMTESTVYTFNGWTPEIEKVTTDATYTAVFDETDRFYTVIFYDEDGETELWNTQVKYGTDMNDVKYEGTLPIEQKIKGEDIYNWRGWIPNLGIVTEDTEYVARYIKEGTVEYTIRFLNYDNKVLQTSYLYAGDMPKYEGETPVKPSTDSEVFTFAGWEPEIKVVSKDQDYVAQFTPAVRQYEITWVVKGETTVEKVNYGEMPVAPKVEDYMTESTVYTFKGWNPAVVEVTEDAQYEAIFDEAVRQYEITWVVKGETTVEKVNYGEIPVAPKVEGYMSESTVYTFKGWNPAVVEVTEDARYEAIFDEAVRQYEITWVVKGETTVEKVNYGEMPVAPKVEGYMTESTVYTFKGWTPALAEVTEDATYTAQFNESVRQYEITWVVKGETTVEKVNYGEMPVAPKVEDYMTESTVYTFKGWNPEIVEVTEDAQYEAIFDEAVRQYEITWVVKGETTVEKVNYGEMPVAPKVEGYMTESTVYTFKGWNPAVVEVTEDAQYEAIFDESVREYEITWVVNDKTVKTESVAYGTMPVAPQVEDYMTESTVYTFKGWNPAVVEVTEDAQYEAIFDEAVRQYEITWIVNGQTTVTKVNYDEMPVAPQVNGYQTDAAIFTFDHWTPELVKVTANATYTAVFTSTVREYEITWKVRGEVAEVTTVAYGEMPVGPQVESYMTESSVYRFNSWSPALAKVTKNATYTATFIGVARKYEITWVVNDEIVRKDSLAYNAMPTAPQVEDYTTESTVFTFAGWNNTIVKVNGDATYTAKFNESVRQYEITWVTNDGTITTLADYGVVPAAPEVENYMTEASVFTFAGWTPEVVEVTAEATYTALYDESVREYEITWVVNGETTVNAVKYGDTPVAPEVEDYMTDATIFTFAGWTPEVVAVNGDATYTAVFTETTREYNITWVVNGEETITVVKYGERPVAPVVDNYTTVDSIYTFIGWTPSIVRVKGEATYTAVFKSEIRMYILTLITTPRNGGEIEGAQTGAYEYGTELTITAVANSGYTFAGWQDDPEADATRQIVITDHLTLTATFTKSSPTPVEEINDEDAVYDNGVVRNLTGKTIYVYSAAGQLVNATDSDLDMSQMQRGAFVITNGNWSIRVVIP